MKAVLKIDMGNAAFGDEPSVELARILRELADRVTDGSGEFERFNVRDYNGNTVGQLIIK